MGRATPSKAETVNGGGPSPSAKPGGRGLLSLDGEWRLVFDEDNRAIAYFYFKYKMAAFPLHRSAA